MNTVRLIGLLLLIVGVVLHFTFEGSIIDFFKGLLFGAGFIMLVVGRIGKRKLQ